MAIHEKVNIKKKKKKKNIRYKKSEPLSFGPKYKPTVDNRSDAEIALANGFDLKTSFRK